MKRVIARVFEPIIVRAVELKVQENQGTEEKKFIKYRDIKVHYSLTLCILCTFLVNMFFPSSEDQDEM